MTGEEEQSWFDRLDAPAREALVAAARTRSFAPHSLLVEEGTTSGLVIVVLGGRVKISTVSSDGRETTLAAIGPGEVIGELSALDGRQHSATATAIDTVEALVIRAADFRRVAEHHGSVGLALLHTLASRLRSADRVRVEFGGRDVVQRVCALLVQLARQHGEPAAGGGVRITTGFSQEELATWLGSSREAVNKALRQLRTLGLVETGRRQLVVRDSRRLTRLAER